MPEERRYGRITPQRTPKGHRLYSVWHVAQIREVLGWLQRGVAVSQVKRLLQESPASPEVSDSPWVEQQQLWLRSIEQLAERQLDKGLHQTLALYPPETLCQHLLLPLLERLELRWRHQTGLRLVRVFFLSWLRTRLGANIAQRNRLQSGLPLLVLNLSDSTIEPGLWLSAWLASSTDCPLRVLEWAVPAEDLAQAHPHRATRGTAVCRPESRIRLSEQPARGHRPSPAAVWPCSQHSSPGTAGHAGPASCRHPHRRPAPPAAARPAGWTLTCAN